MLRRAALDGLAAVRSNPPSKNPRIWSQVSRRHEGGRGHEMEPSENSSGSSKRELFVYNRLTKTRSAMNGLPRYSDPKVKPGPGGVKATPSPTLNRAPWTRAGRRCLCPDPQPDAYNIRELSNGTSSPPRPKSNSNSIIAALPRVRHRAICWIRAPIHFWIRRREPKDESPNWPIWGAVSTPPTRPIWSFIFRLLSAQLPFTGTRKWNRVSIFRADF
jgi:hypothetical protein